MAIGIPFAEANTVLRAPTREDAAAGTVYDLHIHRYRDLDQQPNVISKWQLTPEDLTDVAASGGALWFGCWGETHPPIWISGHDPFVRSKATAASGPPTAAELVDVIKALIAIRPTNWDDHRDRDQMRAWHAADAIVTRVDRGGR